MADPDSRTARAEALLQIGRAAEAERLLRERLAEDSEDWAALSTLVRALLVQSRADEGVAVARLMVGARPADGFAHCLLAQSLLVHGKRADAWRAAQEAVRLIPHSAFAWWLVSCTESNLPQALAAINESIRLDPFDPDYHNQAGIVLDDLNQVAEARRAFQTAISLDPEHSHAINNLASLDMSQGKLLRAAAGLRSSLAHNPQSTHARSNLDLLVVRMSWLVMMATLGAGIAIGVLLMAKAPWVARAGTGAVLLIAAGLLVRYFLAHLPPGIESWGRGLWGRVNWAARRILGLAGFALVCVTGMALMPYDFAIVFGVALLGTLRILGILIICWWVISAIVSLVRGK